MKTWNVPAVEELNVELTANGCIHFLIESCITHGSHCSNPNPGDQPTGGDDFSNDPETES